MLEHNFYEYLAQTNDHPLAIEVERAEGIYIYDKTGKAYIDMISGLAVNNTGHRHPKVLEAIVNQAGKYLHVIPYGEFIQQPQVELARRMSELLPDNLSQLYIVNSGTEANEGALKLAKRYTGRRKLIAFNRSYHGSTHGSLSVSGNENKKYAVRPLLPEVEFIEFNKLSDLSRIDEDTAAVIIEPIQGDAGVRIPSQEFIQKLRDRCSSTGTLLIFDEIQTGFGRTGKLFAFEHFDVYPDILTMAKGMGGGMPIGAFSSSKEIMSTLKYDPMLGHITTFGGHPISAAAALANVGVLTESDLIAEVESKGAYLESLIDQSKVIEIRRIGLMFALEFESFEVVEKIVKNCLRNGIITFWFLSCSNSFRLAPPLTISNTEIEKACLIINNAIIQAYE